jgi:hypothetical protein
MTRESSLQSNIIVAIRRTYGPDVDIINMHGSQWQRVGNPDLIIAFYGYFIGVEVKQPERKVAGRTIRQTEQTNIQKAIAAKLTRAHTCVFVTRSVNDCLSRLRDFAHSKGLPCPDN